MHGQVHTILRQDKKKYNNIWQLWRSIDFSQRTRHVDLRKFSDKNSNIFLYFWSKYRLWVFVRTASARRFQRVPTIYSGFSRNKKNNVYPCEPQFYCIKVVFKGVKIISVCFRDGMFNTCLRFLFKLDISRNIFSFYLLHFHSQLWLS